VRDEALKEMVLPPIGRLVVCYLHTPHGFGTSKLGEKFDKGIGAKYVELAISDRASKMQPEFMVREWE